MSYKVIFSISLFFLTGFTLISNSEEELCADDIIGVWEIPEHAFHVEIEKRGDLYFGTLVYCRDSSYPNGILKLDVKNPDPELRKRPYRGIEVLQDITYAGNGKYKNGRIYEPEVGSYYSCQITLVDKTTAKMRGFVGIPLFGKTEYCYKLD
ncbi:MAG: DUF2147 domain-containing protein [Chitinophagales bacterium]|nr:DUF2147 domain-containing protein [Chitinophagales bacterium]